MLTLIPSLEFGAFREQNGLRGSSSEGGIFNDIAQAVKAVCSEKEVENDDDDVESKKLLHSLPPDDV